MGIHKQNDAISLETGIQDLFCCESEEVHFITFRCYKQPLNADSFHYSTKKTLQREDEGNF